jgi:membrane protein YqaA with SNARE-associated domain
MSLLLDPKIWFLVVIVSALGTVIALTYYYLGKRGFEVVLDRFPQLGKEQWNRVEHLYTEHGSSLVFLASAPVIGVLFATVAGAVGVRVLTYFVLVLLGRVLRNWIIVLFLDQTLTILLGG